MPTLVETNMKRKYIGLLRTNFVVTVKSPRRLANFSKEEGKEDHHTLTD